MSEHKCKECGKEFSSKDALDMHNNSKHYKAPKVKVNKKKIKGWGIFILIIALVLLASYFAVERQNAPGKYDAFAQCLTESGVKEYGAFWCPNCQTQKKLFGRSFQYINYVECSNSDHSQNEFCSNANIEAYPTWEFGDGERVVGLTSLERISVISGCELPK